MIQWNLRIKMLLVIGLVIFVVLGTSAYVQLQMMKQDFLDTIECVLKRSHRTSLMEFWK
jgi:CHASE3 domain sensor protein